MIYAKEKFIHLVLLLLPSRGPGVSHSCFFPSLFLLVNIFSKPFQMVKKPMVGGRPEFQF